MPPERLRTMPGKSIPNKSKSSLTGAGGGSSAKLFGVLMLSTTIAGELPGVTVAGEKEHAVPGGRPEQEKEMGLVKGATPGITLSSYCPGWPARTVALLVRAPSAKSVTVTCTAVEWVTVPGAVAMKGTSKYPPMVAPLVSGVEMVAVTVTGAPAKVMGLGGDMEQVIPMATEQDRVTGPEYP